MKLWSILAMKLVNLLNDGDTTEPAHSAWKFGAGQGSRASKAAITRISGIARKELPARSAARIGNVRNRHNSDRLLLAFIIQIEKRLVFDDWCRLRKRHTDYCGTAPWAGWKD